jgi:hypothetical protein
MIFNSHTAKTFVATLQILPKFKTFAQLACLTILAGCVEENAVPAYLNLSPFTLVAKGEEGTAQHKISDAWVYVDGQNIGIFELPATVPVVELGNRTIEIAPGIRNNGTRSNPIIYPMVSFFRTTADFKAADTTRLALKTNYLSGLKFWVVENFESGNSLRVNREVGGTPPSVNIVSNGFEGKGAEIKLTKNNPLMEKAIVTKAQLPDNAIATFLELHYKTESPLEVAIWGTSSSNQVGITTAKIILRPNTDWNKTYLNLTQEAKDMRMTDFQVVFRSLLPDTLQQATILLDNIKLIQK